MCCTFVAAVALSAAAATPQYAGLRNQGNTCYMNSLLQSICHVPGFARAVYELPVQAPAPAAPSSDGGAAGAKGVVDPADEAAEGASAVAFEMVRLLHALGAAPALGKRYVGTEKLTRSLGMGARATVRPRAGVSSAYTASPPRPHRPPLS